MCDNETLQTLESRVAFQEAAIDQLSDTLARQQLELDKMSRMLHHLTQRIQELNEGQSLSDNNQPPPHY